MRMLLYWFCIIWLVVWFASLVGHVVAFIFNWRKKSKKTSILAVWFVVRVKKCREKWWETFKRKNTLEIWFYHFLFFLQIFLFIFFSYIKKNSNHSKLQYKNLTITGTLTLSPLAGPLTLTFWCGSLCEIMAITFWSRKYYCNEMHFWKQFFLLLLLLLLLLFLICLLNPFFISTNFLFYTISIIKHLSLSHFWLESCEWYD